MTPVELPAECEADTWVAGRLSLLVQSIVSSSLLSEHLIDCRAMHYRRTGRVIGTLGERATASWRGFCVKMRDIPYKKAHAMNNIKNSIVALQEWFG